MNIREALKELKEVIPNGFTWCLSLDYWKFEHSENIKMELKLWIDDKSSPPHGGKFIYGSLEDIINKVKAFNFEKI